MPVPGPGVGLQQVVPDYWCFSLFLMQVARVYSQEPAVQLMDPA